MSNNINDLGDQVISDFGQIKSKTNQTVDGDPCANLKILMSIYLQLAAEAISKSATMSLEIIVADDLLVRTDAGKKQLEQIAIAMENIKKLAIHVI
jgi:hypothetical protein